MFFCPVVYHLTKNIFLHLLASWNIEGCSDPSFPAVVFFSVIEVFALPIKQCKISIQQKKHNNLRIAQNAHNRYNCNRILIFNTLEPCYCTEKSVL